MVDQWVMVGTNRLKRMMPVVQKALHDITQAFATGSTVPDLSLLCSPSPLRLTRKRPASEEALRERRKQTTTVPYDENTERPPSCVHVYPFTGNPSMRLQRPRR